MIYILKWNSLCYSSNYEHSKLKKITPLSMHFQSKARRRKEVRCRLKDEGSNNQKLLKKKVFHLGLKGRWEGAEKRFFLKNMSKMLESTITLEVSYSLKLPMSTLVYSGSKSSSLENLSERTQRTAFEENN